MISKNNIINLDQKRAEKGAKAALSKGGQVHRQDPLEIVDITEKRQKIISQERRQVKRTILTEFIGAFVVVPNIGLMKVAVYDISEDGISFDMESEDGRFKEGEEVAVRVYLNQNTYFPFIAKIQNVRDFEDDGVIRHGGALVKESVNEEALFHFVKFIETVSASLERDGGDIMVSNLK